eukprot:1108848-Rhodomonas_salina.2
MQNDANDAVLVLGSKRGCNLSSREVASDDHLVQMQVVEHRDEVIGEFGDGGRGWREIGHAKSWRVDGDGADPQLGERVLDSAPFHHGHRRLVEQHDGVLAVARANVAVVHLPHRRGCIPLSFSHDRVSSPRTSIPAFN